MISLIPIRVNSIALKYIISAKPPRMDRHADNTFQEVCVPVCTGTSKGDKLLKMPTDLISDGVIFQNFLEGMPYKTM